MTTIERINQKVRQAQDTIDSTPDYKLPKAERRAVNLTTGYLYSDRNIQRSKARMPRVDNAQNIQ